MGKHRELLMEKLHQELLLFETTLISIEEKVFVFFPLSLSRSAFSKPPKKLPTHNVTDLMEVSDGTQKGFRKKMILSKFLLQKKRLRTMKSDNLEIC